MRLRRKKTKPAKTGPSARLPKVKTQELMPPEGVPLRFEISSLGTRFGAQIIDIIITVIALIALVIFLFASGIIPSLAILSVGVLLFFFIRVPYYALSEMIWNGQTIGKRICRIRVVSCTGRSLTPHQIVARNLMREMEVFAPGTAMLVATQGFWEGLTAFLWIAGVLLVPIFSKRNQRLGDIIANTSVVRNPVALLYPDLAAETPTVQAGQYEFFPNQLDQYGAYELQVLAELLQNQAANQAPKTYKRRLETLTSVGKRIREKIDYAFPVAAREEEEFLKAFYRAQRAYLEQKKLFGDARADKFHGSTSES